MARRTRRGAAAVTALILAGGPAACGSAGEEAPEEGAPSVLTATAAPTTHPDGTGARADLADARCEADDGAWSLTGTLANSGDRQATYTVLASVAEIQGGNVKGSVQVVEEIGPDDTVEIDEPDFLTDPADGLQCAISVHRR